MRTILFILFVSCSLSSCDVVTMEQTVQAIKTHGVRTYTDGKLIDNKDQKLQTDSILVVGINDSVPEHSALLGNTELNSPTYFRAEEQYVSGVGTSMSYARFEARRLGANIIKIDGQQPFKSRLFTRMYVLKEPYFSHYRQRLDSTHQAELDAGKDVCSIHVKFGVGNTKIPVYFNDSLVGISEKMFGMDIQRQINREGNVSYRPMDLRFGKSGFFRIGKEKYDPTTSMYLDKGVAYYFYVFYSEEEGGSGPILRQVSEVEYVNNEINY
jgi:hypothetical protein